MTTVYILWSGCLVGIQERRKREKLERRDSILQAAVRVYMEEGYHATTMEKIADDQMNVWVLIEEGGKQEEILFAYKRVN